MDCMVDKPLIIHRFSRAIGTYDREAVAQRQIAFRMGNMLGNYLPHRCNHVLEIGCGTGFLTRRLIETFHPRRLTLNDLCPDMRNCFADLLATGQAVFQAGDAEQADFPEGQDLIVSCSALQWFVRPERFFERCSAWLNHRGYMAFSTFGRDNLKEVAAVTGSGLTYRPLDEWVQMLAPRYDIVMSGEERIRMDFGTPLQVLHHLKQTGVAAVGRQAWTRKDLKRFCDEYNRRFAEGNKVTLTYHPIYLIARKRT